MSVACAAAADLQGVRWADALKQEADWYGSREARRIADSVLAYQHRSGGWPKNIDMSIPPSAPLDGSAAWPTIDNQATFTQIRFLARVNARATDPRYREGALRGIDYLLSAQYANGGWPQFFPLRSDYSRYITYNDGAMAGVMALLDDVSRGEGGFAFVDGSRRVRSGRAVDRGVEVTLKAQIRVDGTLTAWCAQHDEVTLEPRRARAYEHPSLSGYETVGIVRFLIERDTRRPQPALAEAIDAAVAWLERAKLRGWRIERRQDPSLPGGYDRVMVRDAAAPPLWARFYEVGTNRPIFSGRDGSIHDSLADIEHERRNGYDWVGDWPRTLLERDYPRWRDQRRDSVR